MKNHMTDNGESVNPCNATLGECNNNKFLDILFDWFYSLTMRIYMLDAKRCSCSKGSIKRWSDLADLWGACASARKEHNLFALAMHKIHWGFYPVDFPEIIPVDMVEEVVKILYQDCEAFKGWKRNKYYRSAFDDTLKQGRPIGKHAPTSRSNSYLKYIRNRTWLNVVYKQNPPPAIDLAHYARAEFVSAKKHAKIYAECHGYEMVIVGLLPDAATWTESQWRDERLLYKMLKNKFGIEFKTHAEEIDKVIDFLMELWYFKSLSVWHLLRIKHIPDTLMEAIWPANTRHEITKLLCLAYSRVKSANTYLGKWGQKAHYCSWEHLQESWLLKRCRDWVQQKDLSEAMPKTKDIVLLVDSGIAQERSQSDLRIA